MVRRSQEIKLKILLSSLAQKLAAYMCVHASVCVCVCGRLCGRINAVTQWHNASRKQTNQFACVVELKYFYSFESDCSLPLASAFYVVLHFDFVYIQIKCLSDCAIRLRYYILSPEKCSHFLLSISHSMALVTVILSILGIPFAVSCASLCAACTQCFDIVCSCTLKSSTLCGLPISFFFRTVVNYPMFWFLFCSTFCPLRAIRNYAQLNLFIRHLIFFADGLLSADNHYY